MSIMRKKKKKTGFTVIDNQIINDDRISFKAKGIFLYLWSKVDIEDWDFNIINISNVSTDGKDSVRSGINELEKYAYIERISARKGGQFNGHDYLIDDAPEIDRVGNSNADRVGFAVSEKPTETSTNKPKTDSIVETDVSQSQNSNEYLDDILNLSAKYSDFTEAYKLSKKLDACLKTSLTNYKQQTEKMLIKWGQDIEKLIRLDKATVRDIGAVIEWIHTNSKGSFWITNIKSGAKLRKQFDTLAHQMQSSMGSNLDVVDKIAEIYGKGNPFLKIKLSGKLTTVCLFENFTKKLELYDYLRNDFISKSSQKTLMTFISANLDDVLSGKYKG